MTIQTEFESAALPLPLSKMPSTDFGAVRFAGYAALFDLVDGGGDSILPGAFRASLEERCLTGDALPLLWQHRPNQRIGWVERIAEDRRGLRVVARIDNPQSMAAKMLRAGQLSGLSFGYRARAARVLTLESGRRGRELAALDIFEVSLVARPMQQNARVHYVV